jgi:aldose sugar dehydrogenase
MILVSTAGAQPARRAFELGEGPWHYTTFEQQTPIEVSVVTRGLERPWAMVFVPGTAGSDHPTGDALITESRGSVRLFRKGALAPEPIADLSALSIDQLFDITLHPGFESNGLIYLTYLKQAARPDGAPGYWATSAAARARFDGERLVDVEEIFAANAWRETPGGNAIRVTFAPDGSLFMSSSHRLDPDAPQRLDTHIGKILRLTDDGGVPADNPFVGAAGALPEIFSYGHRTVMGLALHPETNEMWELENGPHGGDEVNVLRAGANYGWPVVTYGREYDGTRVPRPWREGMEQPELFWVPSITVSSFVFYTGDAFPAWKNDLFVSAMNVGRLPGTGHIQRIVFNEHGEVRREQLLNDLQQRIRYIGQGPDGLLYLLTDGVGGALLRIAPGGDAAASAPPAASAVSSVAPAAPAAPSAPLFADFDCMACHEVDRRTLGPSYREIARRYAPTAANVELLAARIIEGSVGIWGETPMAPHSGLAIDDAEAMVADILRLNEQ